MTGSFLQREGGGRVEDCTVAVGGQGVQGFRCPGSAHVHGGGHDGVHGSLAVGGMGCRELENRKPGHERCDGSGYVHGLVIGGGEEVEVLGG